MTTPTKRTVFCGSALVPILQVRLLAHGFLDAEVHPEVAAGVVDALWLAARHTAAEVRPAA